jgi:UDPglucose--hexose-1-phosphate uridylyltransferase
MISDSSNAPKPSEEFKPTEHSHKRFNPLTRSFVLVSPHRAKRPWLGQEEAVTVDKTPSYMPSCFLCPGNPRISGSTTNPQYTSTFVFGNDFPAVQDIQPSVSNNATNGVDDLANRLLKIQGVRGQCKVVCFSPNHALSMAEMNSEEIRAVINAWVSEYTSLGAQPHISHVQIFENKGAVMGCSNPHPHGQIWATEDVPEEPAKELESLGAYKKEHGGACLLCDYATLEVQDRSRIVVENDSFLCVVPFWAVWPFETMILSKAHAASLLDLDDKQKDDLADILSRITVKYDNLFQVSFPYSMGIHQAPTDGSTDSPAHLHLHFYPPLLRSATVKKFLVGWALLLIIVWQK